MKQEPHSEIVKALTRLGFSNEAIEIYLAILSSGPTARQSSLDSAVAELRQSGLVGQELLRGRPRIYAVDPATVWKAHAYDLDWQTERAPEPIHDDWSQDERLLRKYLCLFLAESACKLGEGYRSIHTHQTWDAQDSAEFTRLLCEALGEARKEILAVSRSPRLANVAAFWSILTTKIRLGVRYKRIADIDEIIDHGLNIVERDIHELGIDLSVLERTSIMHKFYTVDGTILGVFHSRPGERRGVGRITRRRQIAKRWSRRYWQYREKALPGAAVVSVLRRSGDSLLEDAARRLPPEEVAWLRSLMEMGKFSVFHKECRWTADKLRRVESRAALLGYVRRNESGDINLRYPITQDDIRLQAGRLTSDPDPS